MCPCLDLFRSGGVAQVYSAADRQSPSSLYGMTPEIPRSRLDVRSLLDVVIQEFAGITHDSIVTIACN